MEILELFAQGMHASTTNQSSFHGGEYENLSGEEAETRKRRPWSRAVTAAALAAAGLVAAVITLQADTSAPSYKGRSLQPSMLIGAKRISPANRLRDEREGWIQAGVALDKERLPSDVKASMNFSVNPCDNFYEYVCGTWVHETEIPPDKTRFAKSWDVGRQHAHEKLAALMTKDWPLQSPFVNLNRWYQSCMNVDAVNSLGAKPLQPMLQRIGALKTLEDLQDYLVDVVPYGLPTLMRFKLKGSTREVNKKLLSIRDGGCTFNDPFIYHPINASIVVAADGEPKVEALRQLFINLNFLAGSSLEEAEFIANRTIELERVFAEWLKEDPYHHAWVDDPLGPLEGGIDNLDLLAPSVPWRRIFQRISDQCQEWNQTCNKELLEGEDLVIVTTPYWYIKLDEALKGSLHILSTNEHRNITIDYFIPLIRSHYIYVVGPLLSEDFLNAIFKMKAFLGDVQQQPDRSTKCVKAVSNGLSALSDQAYVATYFTSAIQADAWAMLSNLKGAFYHNLETVDWLDNTTHAAALRKVAKLELNLGGPEEYKMMSYNVSESYFENSRNAYHVKLLRMFMGMGVRHKADKWSKRASTVNAWYNIGDNALFVPAGILTRPFFSDTYPLEQNFGAIGSIMAHEMTHGFDTDGAQWDDEMRKRKWWSSSVINEFHRRTKCVKKLYDSFTIDGMNVRGHKTVAENIADFGGLKVSYQAYLSWYNDTVGGEPPLSSKRLFFIAYGQNWCDKERGKSAHARVRLDVHSPEPFRCNGVVSQNDAFADVFACPVGTAMNPLHKCAVWKRDESDMLHLQSTGRGMHVREIDSKRQEPVAHNVKYRDFWALQQQI